jgi:hypothetical protein
MPIAPFLLIRKIIRHKKLWVDLIFNIRFVLILIFGYKEFDCFYMHISLLTAGKI